MFVLGHVAAGYLSLSLFCRLYRRDVPTDASIPMLVIGTLLPDLIDKPLAWWLGVLPAGRSLGHSLLFAIPVLVLVGTWLRSHDYPAGATGFAIGYLSHLFADTVEALGGGLERTTFLAWPLLQAPEYATRPVLWPPRLPSELTVGIVIELSAGLLVVLVWFADGSPGLPTTRSVTDPFRNSE